MSSGTLTGNAGSLQRRIAVAMALLCMVLTLPAQDWKPVGPFNRSILPPGQANGQGSGRIKCLEFYGLYGGYDIVHQETNRTIFAGSPFGGIWISRDDGATWSTEDPYGEMPNLTTDFLPGCGVMDIVADHTTWTTLYAVINYGSYTNLVNGQGHQSVGVYKYTPSTGWQPTGLTYPFASKKTIMQIRMHPTNNAILFACTSDGVYMTTNAGATWNIVLSNGSDLPFRNIVFDANNSQEVYAAGRDIYKSTDGGQSWTAISNFATIINSNSGTILTNVAVRSSTGVYACVLYMSGTVMGYRCYYYNGSTWTMLSVYPFIWAWSDDRLVITLKTSGGTDYLYSGQEVLHRYNSTTSTWGSAISDYGGNMHPDIHDIVFAPDNSALWVAHDGGISKASNNLYTGQPTWQAMNNGLNVSTIYSFAGAELAPDLYLVGEIDNGNSLTSNADENNFANIVWEGYKQEDGAEKLIDRSDPYNWIERVREYTPSNIQRNTSGDPINGWSLTFQNYQPGPVTWQYGEDFAQFKPLVEDFNYPNVIYRGVNGLLRSSDYGANSEAIFISGHNNSITNSSSYVNCIAPAPSNSGYLYINTVNPYFNTMTDRVLKTTDALGCPYLVGNNCTNPLAPGCEWSCWTDITPPWPPNLTTQQINQTRITALTVSDKNPNQVYVGYSYSSLTSGQKVMMYDGSNWINYSNGLPNLVDITSLIYERGSNDGIYAGTDIGVYYRNKNMSGWIPFMTNLPHVLVNKLEINYTENTLRAGTLGRGIWKSPLYCPGTNQTFNACNNCIPTNTVIEANVISMKNSVFNQSTLYFRATDYIEMTPDQNATYLLLSPDASNATSILAYIHGCSKLSPGSTFRTRKQEQAGEQALPEEDEKESFSVFPNPGKGLFRVRTNMSGKVQLSLFDISGRLVMPQTDMVQEQEINASHLEKGVYILQIRGKKGTETKKVIIE